MKNRLEKRCFIEGLRGKYNRSSKKQKGEILTLIEEALEVGRRQAKRLMVPQKPGRPKTPLKPGRPGRYQDPAFKRALRGVWKEMRYMCSRSMKSALPDWLPEIEQERRKPFPDDIRERLLSISPSTMDRILRYDKVKRGKSLTRSGSFLDQIPIQENVWDVQIPGFLEADTVAHCGGSMLGEFINTLTMVDIATLWTENSAVFGKGSTPIVHAIEDIENNLPFLLRGYDSDNGTEVLNQHVLRYFQEERLERGRGTVQVTRSRAYKKNDQAHVEQRNNSVARKWLGYERLGFVELQPLVNYYYASVLCPMLNHFFPVFKLQDKIRIKSRTRRVYKAPITPYQRVMESPHVDDKRKRALKEIHEGLSPVKLSKLEQKVRMQIDIALKSIKDGNATKAILTPPPVPLALQNDGSNFRASSHTKVPLYKNDT